MLSSGFFQLEDPYDLKRKLDHDFERLRSNRLDAYAAFDFFVTATHMSEWIQRVGWPWTQPTEDLHRAVFKLCRDLGNGAKHFVLHEKFNNPTEVRDGAFDAAALEPSAFYVGDLVLHLNEPEAKALGDASITMLQLAAMVLGFWEEDFKNRGVPLEPPA